MPDQPLAQVARRHVVLLIHGIRTQAEWQQRAAAALEEEPTIRVRPTRYEFLDVLRFLLPFRAFRRRPVQRITALLRDELSRGPAKLSLIAHSFGTYIVSRILEEEPDIDLDRLILCGSIIPDSFPWANFRHRLASQEHLDWPVINDCGMHDKWPVLAQSITWGYGSSGRFGFGHGRVKDRFHPVGHGGFFTRDFIVKYWLPYLTAGQVVEGTLDRPVTPWWLSALTVVKLRYLIMAAFVAVAVLVSRAIGVVDWSAGSRTSTGMVLQPTSVQVPGSLFFDQGQYLLQTRVIAGEPHRVLVIVQGPREFRVDFPSLMKDQRVEFHDRSREYALHVADLEAGIGGATGITIEVARIK